MRSVTMSQSIMKNAKFYPAENASIGVVLFHAYTGSPNDFTFLARRLQREGIEVLCPTFEGHATNDIYDLFDAHPEDWWLQAQDALRIMQARQYQKVYVFGLSLGGIFATRLLTEFHDANLAGGVFNSPVYTAKPIDVQYFFELYVKELYRKQDQLTWYNDHRADIIEHHLQQIDEIHYFATSFQMSLQDIVSRYYIAQSVKDEMIDPEDAMLLEEALFRAKVETHWFPENTHVITTNRQRETFEDSVVNFIINE